MTLTILYLLSVFISIGFFFEYYTSSPDEWSGVEVGLAIISIPLSPIFLSLIIGSILLKEVK